MTALFYVDCQSPAGEEPALISYQPDEEETDVVRQWNTARAFRTPPPTPGEGFIEAGEGGAVKELYWSPLCLMSRRLVTALRGAGVDNLEVFEAKVHDFNSGEDLVTHQAVNIVGRGTLELGLPLFRVTSGGVVVTAAVRAAIVAAGVDTLEFTPAE